MNINQIDSSLPIKITSLSKIIINIHDIYPFVDKTTIAFVVKQFLIQIRKDLLSGKEINFKPIFRNMKLDINTLLINNKETFSIKVKNSKIKLK